MIFVRLILQFLYKRIVVFIKCRLSIVLSVSLFPHYSLFLLLWKFFMVNAGFKSIVPGLYSSVTHLNSEENNIIFHPAANSIFCKDSKAKLGWYWLKYKILEPRVRLAITPIHYCLSKQSWPILYSSLLNKMGQFFLDT